MSENFGFTRKIDGILYAGMPIVHMVVEHELLHSLVYFKEYRKVWQNILKCDIYSNLVRAGSVHSSQIIANVPSS